MIGIFVQGASAPAAVDGIKRAESLGIPAIWLVSGGPGADSLTVCAAAATVTERVKMGTSIVQTWPRHPLAIAHQALAINALAPGRFRLGIGTGHEAGMTGTFGVQWHRPLSQLREYLTVIKTLFSKGEVDFQGEFVTARAQIPQPVDIPVMASALQSASFETCGEIADGAITWVCPWSYLREVGLPALQAGAGKAGRPPPPIVVHVPICVHDDVEEVRAAAREQLGRYTQVPFYQRMFAAAGFGDLSGGISDRLADALVVHGDQATVAARLKQIVVEGAGEIIAHPVLAGADRAASLTRVFDAVAAAQ